MNMEAIASTSTSIASTSTSIASTSTSNKSFDDIPTEILIQILTECINNCGAPRKCINRLSLVCRKWFHITQKHAWQKDNVVFSFNRSNMENELIFKTRIRTYCNIKLKGLFLTEKPTLENCYRFLSHQDGDLIESLGIYRCALRFTTLCTILLYFNNLKELHIEGCAFSTSEIFPLRKEETDTIAHIMSQLTVFRIRFNLTYDVKFLYQLAMLTDNLVTFTYEEKYSQIVNESVRLAHFVQVLNAVCSRNFDSLRYLHICPIFRQNKSCFQQDVLYLKTLSLYGITNSANLSTLLEAVPDLENLNISFIFDFANPEIDINNILQTPKNLKNLYLEFVVVDFTKVRGHKYLRFATYSKYFFKSAQEMDRCDSLISLTVINGRKFIDYNFYNYMSRNLRNLETLIIKGEILLDRALQSIFTNLTKLKILVLEECCFSDYAFSGYNVNLHEREGVSINNLSELEELTLKSKNIKRGLLEENIIFPKLKRFGLKDQTNIDIDLIANFIENCPRLEMIHVSIELDEKLISVNSNLQKLRKTLVYEEAISNADYWYSINNN